MLVDLKSKDNTKHKICVVVLEDKLLILDRDGKRIAELSVESGSTKKDCEPGHEFAYDNQYYLHFKVNDNEMAVGSSWATARVEEEGFYKELEKIAELRKNTDTQTKKRAKK